MDIKEIQKIIDLYWNGLTTIEEEKGISSFFAANKNTPPELEKWRNWFAGKEGIERMKLDDTFDDDLLSYIDQSKPSKKKKIRLKHILWTAAASVALICLAYFSWRKEYEPILITENTILIQEQEEYEIIKELLLLTSNKINKTGTILDESLSKMEVINTYINIK